MSSPLRKFKPYSRLSGDGSGF